MQNDYIIEMKDITKRYPGVVALDGIRLQVKKGEVHALLGENGAGKSTLIKTLAGAIHPDEGEILVEGKSYRHLEPRLAMELGIGVIYQEFNLIPYLTVANNIFLGNEPVKGTSIDEKTCIEECEKVFKRLGITLDPRAQVKTLSVAYQQLVEIAKAVSKNAKVLIMDEPTEGLDPNQKYIFHKFIKDFAIKGTVILSTHILEDTENLATRILLINHGQILQDTTPARLRYSMPGKDLATVFRSLTSSPITTQEEAH